MIVVVILTFSKPFRVDMVGSTPTLCLDTTVKGDKRLRTEEFIPPKIQTTKINKEERKSLSETMTNKWKRIGIIQRYVSRYLDDYTNLMYKKLLIELIILRHSQVFSQILDFE